MLDVIEPHLDRQAVRLLAVVPLSGVGFFAGIGAFLSRQVWLVLVLTAVFIYMVLLGLVIDVLRRRAKRQLAECELRLATEQQRLRTARNRFADAAASIQIENSEYFSILSWIETMTVRANGDTEIVRDVHITAGPQGIDVFFSGFISTEAPDRQSDVDVKVVRVLANSEEVACDFEKHWVTATKHRVHAFLPRHYQPGEEVRIKMLLNWPGYSRRLASGEAEPMYWTIGRSCQKLRYELILEGVGLFELPPVVESRPGNPRPTIRKQKNGSHRVLFEVASPPLGKEFGITVTPRRPK